MAEGENTGGNSWESWLGGWVQTAKEKSATALEMVKKDLAEFTCTMQKDTEKAVEITKESINKEKTTHATDRVKAGFTSFLDNISKALVIPPDDDYIAMKVAPDGSGLYDRGKARLHAIQLDASTYMDPPRGPPEQFSMWLDSFNMEEYKGEISELLVSKVEVRALYTKLVPSEVSHAEFWQRYFYRVHQLQCDEARKQALMKRADQTKGDSFSWDDDDEDWSGGEDDDGNHSDWEKMPRPPQSYAAAQQNPSKQLEQQRSSIAAQPTADKPKAALSSEAKETTPQKTIETKAVGEQNSSVEAKKIGDVGSKINSTMGGEQKQEKDNVKGKDLETSMSADAAGSNLDQPMAEKEVNKTVSLSSEPEASQATADATGDSSSTYAQKPSADLWSLHIPDDTASASHSGQDDDVSGDTGVPPEPASPSNIYRQPIEADDVLTGSSSCAAAGGEVSTTGDDQSGVTRADAACGAADMVSTPSIPQQVEQIIEPSPDVSAASVEVAAEPPVTQHADQDVPPPGISPGVGLAEIADPPVVATPSPINNAALSTENQPASVSTPLIPQPAIPEAAQGNSETVPKSDNAPALAQTAAPVAPSSPESTPKASDVVEESPALIQTSEKSEADVKSTPANLTSTTVMVEGADGGEPKEIGMRVKGDMVVVGDRGSPSSSSDSNELKEIGLEEDWEQDFDIEITEDDLKAAEDIAKKLGENLDADDDDWENWE